MIEIDNNPMRILPRDITADLIGVNLRTLERLVASGDFPRPLRVSRNRLGFLASEISQWVAERKRV